MGRWVQYLQLNLANELSPICGTFDIFKVDNRLTLQSQLEIAHEGLKQEHRKGFLLLEGGRLLDTKTIKYHKIPECKKYKLSEYCFL
jgi:hypothetical protein